MSKIRWVKDLYTIYTCHLDTDIKHKGKLNLSCHSYEVGIASLSFNQLTWTFILLSEFLIESLYEF